MVKIEMEEFYDLVEHGRTEGHEEILRKKEKPEEAINVFAKRKKDGKEHKYIYNNKKKTALEMDLENGRRIISLNKNSPID